MLLKPRRPSWTVVLVVCATSSLVHAKSAPATEELQTVTAEIGQPGGRLIIGQRAEPKTLNPVLALDSPSREVIGRMHSDLIHINRATMKSEPALASSWKISSDGRTFTLKLRRGLRFSDGQPFDADDVLFTFQVYLDEKIHSPQRDLLIVDGKPIAITKLDQYTVRFDLAEPYAAAERLFDSIAILPKHLLESAYRQGTFAQSWTLSTSPESIAGLGPYRLKQYVAGQQVVLERNPHYWKRDRKGIRLPYLDQLAFLFAGTEDAQIIRFRAHETDVISRFSSDNYTALANEQQNQKFHVLDLGPSLEYNFLTFNLNDLSADKFPEVARRQEWFKDLRFRQAVSAAIDRAAIVRLVFHGHGAPLWGNVSPGNKAWIDESLPRPERSLERARELLRSAGFIWNQEGQLIDHHGMPVEFSIVASSSNAQRVKMGTIIADDLNQLGMNVHIVPLEFRALLDRVFQSNDYDTCILGLGGGDADPNSEMNVWLSSGSTHVWNLHEREPASSWEERVDQLMKQQLVTLDYKRRKKLYDQVQRLIFDNSPVVFLATPNVLVGAQDGLANFRPAVVEPYVLWNVEELYLRGSGVAGAR